MFFSGTGDHRYLHILTHSIPTRRSCDIVTQTRPKPDDMCALIKAWGVTNADEIRLLKAIAAKPGALRAMTKVLQLTTMLAAGAGAERNIRHIKAAWNRHTATAEAA